jgi:hypothetical protein
MEMALVLAIEGQTSWREMASGPDEVEMFVTTIVDCQQVSEIVDMKRFVHDCSCAVVIAAVVVFAVVAVVAVVADSHVVVDAAVVVAADDDEDHDDESESLDDNELATAERAGNVDSQIRTEETTERAMAPWVSEMLTVEESDEKIFSTVK